ncbi:predicted protein [Uncinocarpus reesii 1704]|uniref:Uncharacterized protein n=1 Tax=Uncinocarpus reesii (strain UAMH 1704) TaxID=336963 RepID=C4JJN3_UNCRE|nr:uncharacterized protein UREG_01840 [Uncinocarpus reesii 1704]EEP76991.1 predicted protein [Uncinocarpus reesii 1704]
MSLFVFQAMLFASCALLYDLNAEHNILSKAQGSVLLTYQSSSVNLHAGSLWLTSAIQNALLLEAHNYHKLDHNDPLRNTKKRLWWSILLRDRILPLGLRRHLQISRPNFDLSLDYMNEDDMQEEIYCSEVYNVETKRHLTRVLNLQCQLAMVLTGVVTTVYSANGFTQPRPMAKTDLEKSMADIVKFREDLAEWANDAKVAFNPFSGSNNVHESVILYSELTYMYYHSARVALCHYETLVVEANPELISGSYEKRLETIKDELESAALGITKCVKRLLAHGVARHLPISAIAYTALPLVLIALDVKLSGSVSQSATRKRRLRYYAEIMQLYRSRYDGTDDVAVYIREILQFAETQNLSISIRPMKSDDCAPVQETRGWAEVFVRQPRFYLRMSLTLDYALARGRYPQDSDLPVLVRELPVKGVLSSTISNIARVQEVTTEASKQDLEQPSTATESSSPKVNISRNADGASMVDVLPATEALSSPTNSSPNEVSPTWPGQRQHQRSTSVQSHSARQRSLSPPRQNFQDINLDFLDLGCAQSMENVQYPEETGVSGDIDWANNMLDEILSAIPA